MTTYTAILALYARWSAAVGPAVFRWPPETIGGRLVLSELVTVRPTRRILHRRSSHLTRDLPHAGVVGRFVKTCTLSCLGEERGINIAERPEVRLGTGGGPDVIARQRYVLPIERSDMGQQGH